MKSPVWYAVGDIHGRFDLLSDAIELIFAHAAKRPARMVFLGDYVDRGPDSRRVVERLIALQQAGAAVCLKGNHEDLMVRALTGADSSAFRLWLDNGGLETLRSYGAASRQGEPGAGVPREHVRWMAGLPLTTADDHRLYVHAGIAPRTAFHRQTEAEFLWIRERFLRAPAKDLDAHVVHGHTPFWERKPDVKEPELLPHRTNLDTGAYATGILSIGVFDPHAPGGPSEVLTVRGQAGPAAMTID
ncbi:MAG: metallophosphoesterase family protein [Caulobacterales bacterium]